MKKLIFFLSIFFIAYKINAQITFQKTYGGIYFERAWSLQQTSDGGYIITGETASYTTGYSDVYLIKTNAVGDTVWTKTFGGSGDETGFSVRQTSDGGYIISGETGFGAGDYSVFLIKTDTNGNLVWSKTYGGPGFNYGYCVDQTDDGGYIISGFGENVNGGSVADVYLIKTNANGYPLWRHIYGGVYQDRGYCVKHTTDGGYIITGYTAKNTFGDYDVYLIKTDSIGTLLWSKSYGGYDYDEGKYVLQTTDGGYIIVGLTASFGVGNTDVYLIRTDSTGSVLWSNTYGSFGYDGGISIQPTTDGGFIITGYTSFGGGPVDAYLIKINPTGGMLWTKNFGGANEEWVNFGQQTTDGGYIIGGYTETFGAGSYDIYLIKTDSLGNSGCHEGNPATILTSPITLVTNPSTMVNNLGSFSTPATVVGSGSIVTTLCTNVGINEIDIDNSFITSPNPSSGNFIISFERIIKGNIEILNILGENIFAENIFNESKKEIELKDVSEGIYFVKVFDGEKSYCKKLMVKHD